MENFWRESLQGIFENFKLNLRLMPTRCELCDVSFMNGRTPNYESIPQQHLYLLRYFSAYLFEYHAAYQQLQTAGFLDDTPRIASLGCGSGIDGAAADFVFTDYTYRGIDRVRWNMWFAAEPPCTGDAGAYIPIKDNIFVFPKSLAELPVGVVDALACNLPRTSAKKICIINSRRKADDLDGEACTKILQGFDLASSMRYTIKKVRPRSTEKTWLVTYNDWFDYPDEIKATISSLSLSCPSRPQCQQGISSEGPCMGRGSNKLCWNGNVPMQWSPVTSDCNFCTDIYLIDRT